MMSHLLFTIDYHDVEKLKIKLLERPIGSADYKRLLRELSKYIDDYAATLVEG
ncbi:hypothetical protein [Mycobacterium uberis]|uniref:hypothetical protein n=1 Tax=Mycobacterium uberis TaxID=2162698 RepID=UPI0026D56355